MLTTDVSHEADGRSLHIGNLMDDPNLRRSIGLDTPAASSEGSSGPRRQLQNATA